MVTLLLDHFNRTRKIHILWQTDSRVAPMISASRVYASVCTPPPESGRNHDLLLVTSVWQRRQDARGYIRYRIIVCMTIAGLARTLCPLLPLKIPPPCCELPIERASWQGTEGSLWLRASKKLRPSVQQPARNEKLPTTTWAWKQMWLEPRQTPRLKLC